MKKTKKALEGIIEGMKKDDKRHATNKLVNFALQKLNSDEYECDEEAAYTADRKELIFIFGKKPELTVPEGVEVIEEQASYRNPHLSKLTLPTTLREIRRDAFYDCDNIEEITFPANMERLEGYAFGDCDNLKQVTFLGTPKHMSRHAFESCDHLHAIKVPAESVKKFVKAFHLNEENADLILPGDLGKVGKASKEKKEKKPDNKHADNKKKGKDKRHDSNKHKESKQPQDAEG